MHFMRFFFVCFFFKINKHFGFSFRGRCHPENVPSCEAFQFCWLPLLCHCFFFLLSNSDMILSIASSSVFGQMDLPTSMDLTTMLDPNIQSTGGCSIIVILPALLIVLFMSMIHFTDCLSFFQSKHFGFILHVPMKTMCNHCTEIN